MNNFLVNEKNGTINVHYDGLNPRQVAQLIKMLQINLEMIKQNQNDPLDVLVRSATKVINLISFQLSWDGIVHYIDLNRPEIPEPDVELNAKQDAKYRQILQQMIGRS